MSIANLEFCKRCPTLLLVHAYTSLDGGGDRCSGEHTNARTHAFFFRRRQKDLSMIVNTISTLRSKHIQHICHLPYI